MIPIIINSRDRVTMLKKMIEWLVQLKDSYIVILDNDSTYEPLLEYYKEIKDSIEIKYLKANLGSTALYKVKEQDNHKSDIFIYTDPDLFPIDECPLDVIEHLKKPLMEHKFNKVGLGLEINDLPDHYDLKQKVINWEKQFWERPYDSNFFHAGIGATFALYHKSHVSGKEHNVHNCLRSNYPYIVRHLPWYLDSNHLDEEQQYYIEHATALEATGMPSSSWCKGRGIANSHNNNSYNNYNRVYKKIF